MPGAYEYKARMQDVRLDHVQGKNNFDGRHCVDDLQKSLAYDFLVAKDYLLSKAEPDS